MTRSTTGRSKVEGDDSVVPGLIHGASDAAIAIGNPHRPASDGLLSVAYRVRGAAYRLKGQMDLALKDFNTAIRMDPDTNKATIRYADDCQICHLCRMYCPVDAITITPEKSIPVIVSWG